MKSPGKFEGDEKNCFKLLFIYQLNNSLQNTRKERILKAFQLRFNLKYETNFKILQIIKWTKK